MKTTPGQRAYEAHWTGFAAAGHHELTWAELPDAERGRWDRIAAAVASPIVTDRDLELTILVLEKYAAGTGPLTPADAAKIAQRIRASPVCALIDQLAALKTDADLDGDMSGDDAVTHLSGFIEDARRIQAIVVRTTGPLDIAYSKINALGGTFNIHDDNAVGYNEAISDALKILTDMGAKDAPYAVLLNG